MCQPSLRRSRRILGKGDRGRQRGKGSPSLALQHGLFVGDCGVQAEVCEWWSNRRQSWLVQAEPAVARYAATQWPGWKMHSEEEVRGREETIVNE